MTNTPGGMAPRMGCGVARAMYRLNEAANGATICWAASTSTGANGRRPPSRSSTSVPQCTPRLTSSSRISLPQPSAMMLSGSGVPPGGTVALRSSTVTEGRRSRGRRGGYGCRSSRPLSLMRRKSSQLYPSRSMRKQPAPVTGSKPESMYPSCGRSRWSWRDSSSPRSGRVWTFAAARRAAWATNDGATTIRRVSRSAIPRSRDIGRAVGCRTVIPDQGRQCPASADG